MGRISGQLLAIAWSDNYVRLISPESNKIIHEVKASSAGDSTITCLGWAANYSDSRRATARSNPSNQSLDFRLRQTVGEHVPAALPDLPRDLALLDVEVVLPKLSLLPPGQESASPNPTHSLTLNLE